MSGYSETKYSASGVKTGTIVPHGSTTVPTGFLYCDGSAVSRTTYANLFSVISTTYGTGDGASTFNLPDLQNNVPLGRSGTKALGSTGGAESQTPSGTVANHTLTVSQIPSHTHTHPGHQQEQGIRHRDGTDRIPQRGDQGSASGTYTFSNTGGGGAHNHGWTGSSMSILQPYLALNYIIKT